MFTKDHIEKYFSLFKQEQLFLIIAGAAALIVAVIFYFVLKTQWYKGFAVPLIVFALLFAGAGINNYRHVQSLRVSAAYNYDMHPEQLKIKELPRVKEMQNNLSLLIYVNLSLIVASFLIFFYFRGKDGNEYYSGCAASLFLMAVISIIAYSIMKNNNRGYAKGIKEFTEKIIVNGTNVDR